MRASHGEARRGDASSLPSSLSSAAANQVQLLTDLLQFHAATYMDNVIVGIPQALQKSSCPMKVSVRE
ncbi:hypothetical protein K503DRAFT_776385 [Rhizopogon vinicolor AM-OR11-026]|uniref:Uncharacterized protein n=1 Tax=Rhizopogon vinicolor AM-OR11-026 TaxID=1314800 RepID=A0A1B7MJC3_9AGAM|nr:hypothetical protein K503DRAFT_776385 [Rhizopogon vinicolor AM-OR11-026]